VPGGIPPGGGLSGGPAAVPRTLSPLGRAPRGKILTRAVGWARELGRERKSSKAAGDKVLTGARGWGRGSRRAEEVAGVVVWGGARHRADGRGNDAMRLPT